MTRFGRLNMVNAAFAHDPAPIDDNCGCYTCQHFSRAYIRHLIIAREMLAATLLSIHNLHTLLALVRNMRQAILDGQFDCFTQDYFDQLTGNSEVGNPG